jgi:alginate O-acetyltransferase complex protein AlgI
MLFNTPVFLVFITVIFFAYWFLPHRFRWILLLASSLFFYGFMVLGYIAVLVASVLFNYYFGIRIGRSEDKKQQERLLTWGVALNVLFLAGFKYGKVICSTYLATLHTTKVGGVEGWIIPLGISFFTFTNISYLIEIKRRKAQAEKHLGHFANYITFFPKLVMGPIEKPQQFLPQLKERHVFDYSRVTSGLRLMVWGFFKKLVIADRLAVPVNAVYGDPASYSGPSIVVATVFYSIQIYADFSGYIDIARGAGKILGFELSRNFNIPYSAKSIKDFWTRWHMTLSNWLRDYLFLPLAYMVSRRLKKDRYLGVRSDDIIYSAAISVTFVICGIWHGVGWTFLLWGSLYAVYLVIGHLTEKAKKRFYSRTGILHHSWLFSTIQILVTLSLVTFAWLFFRASDLHSVKLLLTGLLNGWGSLLTKEGLAGSVLFPGFGMVDLTIVFLCSAIMFVAEYLVYAKNQAEKFCTLPVYLRWGAYYAALMIIFILGKFENDSFIYFQF